MKHNNPNITAAYLSELKDGLNSLHFANLSASNGGVYFSIPIEKARFKNHYLNKLFWYSATFNFRFKVFHIPGKLNVWANHVSRLHQAKHLIAFCQFELSRFGPYAFASLATFHMSKVIFFSFLCYLASVCTHSLPSRWCICYFSDCRCGVLPPMYLRH